MAEPIDLGSLDRVHIIGIGGAGMSAIATVLRGMGLAVSGSDLKESLTLDRLRADGVEVTVGHQASNVGAVDLVTVSTAIPETNVELVRAREAGIPVLRRAEMLRAITATRRTVAVAGTHGKTTTSSMLALVLIEAGLHPSFVIGGDMNEIGSGAAWDSGAWLVVEADESDGTFVELTREAAIVTSIEPDHLEHYGGFDHLLEAFRRFVDETDGPRVVCGDDPVARRLADDVGGLTYGTDAGCDYRVVDLVLGGQACSFGLEATGGSRLDISIPVAGAHNAANAAAAAAMALEIGVEGGAVTRALRRFGGVARRFEFRGEARGVTFIDDYAHLPTEVEAAVTAAMHGAWERIVCVFQPHRYSRTAALWSEFGDSFVGVDRLVVSDIYSAGEPPRPGISGKLIVDAVLDRHPWHDVAYLPRPDDVTSYLDHELRSGDLCLTLGAGDLTMVPEAVQERWRG
jgi:UDP-N-acetylmuramate--alanine ligase